MGLYHTFQGGCDPDPNGGDGVADTPAEANPTLAIKSCAAPMDSCPTLPGDDPLHNYMAYVDPGCRTQFTPGQWDRMAVQWTAFRAANGNIEDSRLASYYLRVLVPTALLA